MTLIRRVYAWASLAIMWAAHISRHTYLRVVHAQDVVRGVRVILVRAGRVVLVRHWYAPGVWTLPGGGVKENETREDAGKREVEEETGFSVNSFSGELGVYDGGIGGRNEVSVLISEDFEKGMRLLPSFEIMERGLFDFDNLPKTLSPANRRRIDSYLRGVRNERAPW